MRAIERGHMTVDASLASLDFLWRAGCIGSADCEGLAALREPPNE